MAGISRPTGDLVGPYDSSKEEANGHNGGKKAPPARPSGTLVGPYDSSKAEAEGHDNG